MRTIIQTVYLEPDIQLLDENYYLNCISWTWYPTIRWELLSNLYILNLISNYYMRNIIQTVYPEPDIQLLDENYYTNCISWIWYPTTIWEILSKLYILNLISSYYMRNIIQTVYHLETLQEYTSTQSQLVSLYSGEGRPLGRSWCSSCWLSPRSRSSPEPYPPGIYTGTFLQPNQIYNCWHQARLNNNHKKNIYYYQRQK